MKKLWILALALAITLTLSSCDFIDSVLGLFKKDAASSEDSRAVTNMTDTALEALLAQGFEKVSEEEAAADTERTVEELLQALRDGEPMTDSSGAEYAAKAQTFSVDLTEMAALQGTTMQFSEEEWVTDKTVETFDMEDFTAEMTPEEKAEWDEMMSKTEEDWEAEFAGMEAEMEEMVNSMNEGSEDYSADTGDVEIPDMDDIKQQIDEAMQNVPDEYKDMIGDMDNLEELLGGLLGGN